MRDKKEMQNMSIEQKGCLVAGLIFAFLSLIGVIGYFSGIVDKMGLLLDSGVFILGTIFILLFVVDRYNFRKLKALIIAFFVIIGIIVLSASVYVMLYAKSELISNIIKEKIGIVMVAILLVTIFKLRIARKKDTDKK